MGSVTAPEAPSLKITAEAFSGINYGNDNRLRLNMTALIGFRNGGAADGVEQIIRAVGHIVGRKL